MTASRTFSFPPPAPMLNENDRLHWAKRASHVSTWRSTTAWYALAAFPRADNPLPPCTIDIAIPVRDRRRRDPANWTPTAKACVDGLVDAGWWTDDSSEYVTVLEPTLVVDSMVVTITARERT
jgi:hypothetical protein